VVLKSSPSNDVNTSTSTHRFHPVKFWIFTK